MIHSELVADCFELARRIRVLDMRASPYDVSSLGLTPVLVETSDGRAQYAAEQRGLALAAEPLRAKLLQRTTQLVGQLNSSAGVGRDRPDSGEHLGGVAFRDPQG
jgi:hypothetical protein